MSSRQKYRKVVIISSERVTAKNSLAGMLCISDYRDTPDSRTLVFERPDKAISTATKPTTTRRKKSANGVDESASKSLAFPGESAPSA